MTRRAFMFSELIKALFFGIVQGITEWLPISSTGHMILFDEFVGIDVSAEFMEMFRVVIQLSSILAVIIIYRKTLFPFSRDKTAEEKKRVRGLWGKIIIAAVPAAVAGVIFDDMLDKYLYNYITVAAALVVYGVVFILMERSGKDKEKKPLITDPYDITFSAALKTGFFQVLSLIPGTSRSGSTIIGAMAAGVSREAAALFSFFLAIPVMFGASFLKIVKYAAQSGLSLTIEESLIAVVGCAAAFAVSCVTVRFLVGFVKRHSFEAFGWYRIALGAAVIIYFAFAGR